MRIAIVLCMIALLGGCTMPVNNPYGDVAIGINCSSIQPTIGLLHEDGVNNISGKELCQIMEYQKDMESTPALYDNITGPPNLSLTFSMPEPEPSDGHIDVSSIHYLNGTVPVLSNQILQNYQWPVYTFDIPNNRIYAKIYTGYLPGGKIYRNMSY